MKSILFVTFLSLTAVLSVNSQASVPDAKTSATAESAAVNTPVAAPAQNGYYVRPDSKTRFNRYAKSMFGPTALGKNVVSAGYGTWRNSPEEWGDNWEGFGRRFASSVAKGVIKNTAVYGLDEAFKLDSGYYRSKNKSVGAKLRNALISPVTARNAEGKRVFGFPRVIGTYTASIAAAELWYPSRFDYKDGLRSGTISLGTNAVFNVVKEFIWK